MEPGAQSPFALDPSSVPVPPSRPLLAYSCAQGADTWPLLALGSVPGEEHASQSWSPGSFVT